MTTEGSNFLTLGTPVYTTDGEKLGQVKEIEGIAFKIDAPLQLDYWLPLSSVGSVAGERITLKFVHDELGVYKMSAPDDIAGTAAAESPGALASISESEPRGDIII